MSKTFKAGSVAAYHVRLVRLAKAGRGTCVEEAIESRPSQWDVIDSEGDAILKSLRRDAARREGGLHAR